MDSGLRQAAVQGDEAGRLTQAPPVPLSGQAAGEPSERLISLIVAAALFMQNLDSTVIATALPTMARAFGADPVHMNVALTAYMFSVALFVPASGWMADRFGTRHVFRAAIGVFTVGSIFCGQAHSLPFLVAARVLQGAGGAMMLPVGRLILLRTVPKERLISAMAWVTMPALIGPVIGPPLGGLIVEYANWRWIFYINLPIGLLGITLASIWVPDRRDPAGRFDLLGLLFSGAALAAFLAVLELMGRGILPGWQVAAIGLAGLCAGAFYARHARGQTRPLLDFSLMRLPSFAISVLAGSLFRIGIGAVPFLLPMLMQLGFGRSAVASGMVTFAAAAGAIISKPGTQVVLRNFGFRRVLVVNGVVSGLGLALYAAFRADWPLWMLYAVLLATGYLRSLQFTAFNTIAYAEVPPARMSAATTLYAALQQISLTVGIPVSAFVLHLVRGAHTVPRPADFSAAFLVVAALATLAGPAALLLPRNAGAEMSGRKG
jgi:EmrB/QacA subfamily drug resistance transporter